ncbi:MAG: DUF4435 domain-containing protein, partial [Prevotella sp.]|nr:DUF4435 domain-containing protein [Prevotella sp.]
KTLLLMTSENNLEYSNSALSVRHTFLETDVVLYVEGENDITFWDERFRRIVSPTFYTIEAVNGKEQLIKYRQGILDGSLNNIIIACDSDYSQFMNNQAVEDPRIILTYGYSIENTMFCPVSVAIYIRRLLHKFSDCLLEVNEWFSNFCNSAMLLLPYEIENAVSTDYTHSRPKMFGLGYEHFSKKGYVTLDDIAIRDYISEKRGFFDEDRINGVIEKIKAVNKDIRFLIQGHFLAQGVSYYLRHVAKSETSKSRSLSNESLYSTFAYCIDDSCEECVDRDYIKAQIKKAYNYFNHPNDVV